MMTNGSAQAAQQDQVLNPAVTWHPSDVGVSPLSPMGLLVDHHAALIPTVPFLDSSHVPPPATLLAAHTAGRSL